jgi:hypothetical protein
MPDENNNLSETLANSTQPKDSKSTPLSLSAYYVARTAMSLPIKSQN